MKERPPTRYARIDGSNHVKLALGIVKDYLPINYKAYKAIDGTGDVYISGIDNAGWTMDEYVIPRLGSGLINAVEISFEEVHKKIPIHMW